MEVATNGDSDADSDAEEEERIQIEKAGGLQKTDERRKVTKKYSTSEMNGVIK